MPDETSTNVMTDEMIDLDRVASWEASPEDHRAQVADLAREAGLAPVELARRGLLAAAAPPSTAARGDLAAEVRALRAVVEALARVSPPALVPVDQAAEMLGVSTKTVRRKIKDGSIPSRRVGRSVRVDLAGLRPLDNDAVARLAREARSGHA